MKIKGRKRAVMPIIKNIRLKRTPLSCLVTRKESARARIVYNMVFIQVSVLISPISGNLIFGF